MRVFLDANVLFSAVWWEEGAAAVLIRLAGRTGAVLLTSPFAGEEARRNLALKAPDRADRLESLLTRVVLTAEPGLDALEAARASGLHEKDVPILAAALYSGADWLVTGDRTHFGGLFGKRVGAVEVVTLRDAVERMLDGTDRR